jgi:Mg-chelatase subunit ChlI
VRVLNQQCLEQTAEINAYFLLYALVRIRHNPRKEQRESQFSSSPPVQTRSGETQSERDQSDRFTQNAKESRRQTNPWEVVREARGKENRQGLRHRAAEP